MFFICSGKAEHHHYSLLIIHYIENRKSLYHTNGLPGTMATGFALLTISPLHEKEVFEALDKKIDEIVEVHPLFGEYDILVKIQCENIDDIGNIVLKKIRAMKGVSDTKTLISTRSLSGEM